MLDSLAKTKGVNVTRTIRSILIFLIVASMGVFTYAYFAQPSGSDDLLQEISFKKNSLWLTPPTAPTLASSALVLMDANSGRILAEKNADIRLPPASLTKMMSLYIISEALKAGQIHLDDKVMISKHAWSTGGSKLFVREGSYVPVETLIQGIIVASGNDACVAMAEHIAGSEKGFSELMNQTAQKLGLKNTHYTNSMGLPTDGHFSTPRDLALLARALVRDFPQYYHWYQQKWIRYNNIKQNNRNRLLWHDESVDGIKTGHTEEAGFCLVGSAKRNDMRLISVIMGAKTDNQRLHDSQSLLNWGFRFFESKKLYLSHQKLSDQRVWQGKEKHVALGLKEDFYITLAKGQYKNLQAKVVLSKPLNAPIHAGDHTGSLVITDHTGKAVASRPLIALNDVPKGGIWASVRDKVALVFHKLTP